MLEQAILSLYVKGITLRDIQATLQDLYQVLSKTIYLALAVNMEGHKELLGIWIAEHEGTPFLVQVLTELNNRGGICLLS